MVPITLVNTLLLDLRGHGLTSEQESQSIRMHISPNPFGAAHTAKPPARALQA
jgi:hypothetical protein